MTKKLDDVRTKGGTEVMKASAGSGKTFSLSREYIRLLLIGGKGERNYHRHILAVTFTNKATDSMKSKIMEDLHVLATEPAKCKFLDYLEQQCGFASEADIQKAAGDALNGLLNDYSAFSVSTIDKFFQRTLKAFSREIGHNSEYRVELDRESLVHEAADRLLDSLSAADKSLLKWLSDSSIEKIENGEGYHLESAVKSFAEGYLSPEYEKKSVENNIDETVAFSEDNLKRLSDICRKVIREFDEDYKKAVQAIVDAITGQPFASILNSNFKKFLASCQAYDGSYPGPLFKKKEETGYWRSACEDFMGALSNPKKKKEKKEDYISPAEASRLQDLCQAFDDLSGLRLKERQTAVALSGQVYVFRTAEKLREEYDALLREKNVLGIDDTNTILKDIIGGTDAPFIYEKTGTRYKHFLLDEFQDTSSIQWECFRPLLANSIAEGCYNLIVGDVKQSIYRWRDADWRILGEKVEEEASPVAVNELLTNWRSTKRVVEFNNAFHCYVARTKGEHTDKLYKGSEQEVSPAMKSEGCVDAVFCDGEDINSYVLHFIKDALSRKFRYKDIAVIVRTNKQGGEVASYLSENGVDVVTDDSLRIGSSNVVRNVVGGLYHIDNPSDKINTYNIQDFDYTDIGESRSLFEMADALLKQIDPVQVNKESLFVLSFLDLIKDYTSSNGNSLHAFLQQWKESGIDKKIASPKDTDAVTIITIHKSKGLDYPVVILPFQTYEYNGSDKVWEAPEVDGTSFKSCAPALYHVNLSEDTLFSGSYAEEERMSDVDYINTWYVAMTRPKQELCIISPEPSGHVKISELLAGFIDGEGAAMFRKGDPIVLDNEEADAREEASKDAYFCRYISGVHEEKEDKGEDAEDDASSSIVLNYLPDHAIGVKASVRISGDAAEYFRGEGDDSKRKRGIVLHSIMQDVNVASDVKDAVASAVADGLLRSSESDEVEASLEAAVASVAARGWFAAGLQGIYSERDIISAGQGDMRPDRVIVRDGAVEIIDYKFGEDHSGYKKQVREYMDLYRNMGYACVRGYLWYVMDGRVEEVL